MMERINAKYSCPSFGLAVISRGVRRVTSIAPSSESKRTDGGDQNFLYNTRWIIADITWESFFNRFVHVSIILPWGLMSVLSEFRTSRHLCIDIAKQGNSGRFIFLVLRQIRCHRLYLLHHSAQNITRHRFKILTNYERSSSWTKGCVQ